MSERTYRKTLAAVFAAALVAGSIGIGWGLPNRDRTWAADSVAPMTPLAVAYQVFASEGFNSGYFYFKYPVGHQLLLAAVQAPVVVWAYVSGDLERISTSYPYGFREPDRYLTALAIATRLVSVFGAAALLLLLAGIGRRLADRTTGVFAALAGASSYPLMFYAHTSNVEVAFLVWATLGLYAVIRAVEEDRPRWYLVFGAAAAMAVSTKEQIAGFVLLLPLVIVLRHWQLVARRAREGLFARGVVTGALASVLVLVAVNAIFFNPSGYVHRLQFLTHTLEPEVRARYAPYEFPIDFAGDWTYRDEIAHARKTASAVASSIGWPATLAALAGVVALAMRRPLALVYVGASTLGYYLFSLRMLKQVEIRYVMPISTLCAIPAGFALAWLWRRGTAGRLAAAAVVAFGLVWSGEVLVLLVDDARYRAERWMAPKLAEGATVEVYQSWTYLPRWSGSPNVRKPDFERISVEGVRERTPDYIVVSSKGKEGITMYPNPDWRDGRGMMLVREDNRRFVEALESGTLGYRAVAEFRRSPLFEREWITSLNPAVTIYAPAPAPAPRTAGAGAP